MSAFTDLGDEKFVSLTTYRRSGDAVSTPVWLARTSDDALVITTAGASGKVKRIRHNPAVAMRPCTARGKIAPGAQPVAGRAEIVVDEAAQRGLMAAIAAKYGVQFTVIQLLERFSRSRGTRVIVRVNPA